MCLAIPGQVIEISQDKFIIDYGSEKREVNFSLVDLSVGDWVIVSNKMIIAKVDEEKAEKFLEVLNNES